MPNIKFVIEYNGAKFHGWQEQPGVRTAQGELKKVIETVLRAPITGLVASGRTDSGVHARAQVVNFYTVGEVDLFRLTHSVSNIMRGDLAVLSGEVVPDSFHSLNDATGKHYRYTILNRTAPAVLDRGWAWFIAKKLDLELMEQAAEALVGVHDFSSFRGQYCQARSPVREIYSSRLTVTPPYIYYDVTGAGFLKHMVRIIVGTIVDIGRGRVSKSIPEIIELKDRRQAGITAPAYGLCLEEVYYGDRTRR